MTTVRRTEGPRAPLFYSALLGLSGIASAQTVDMSALEACSGLETETARLECFEAIVSGKEAAPLQSAVSEPDSVPPAVDPQPGNSGAPVVVVPAAEPAALTVERQPASQSSAPAPSATSAGQAAASEMTADDFGREHLATRSAEAPEVLRARVMSVSKGNHDALVFHLDNGQVWRQIQPRYYPYPRNQEFDATITTGMLGEYQLQVEGEGRKVNVRRLK